MEQARVFAQRFLRFVAAYVALTVAASFGMLILAFPSHPKTSMDWVWLFALALPVTLAGELVGQFIFHNRIAKYIEKRSADRSLSWLRICYGFVAMLLV